MNTQSLSSHSAIHTNDVTIQNHQVGGGSIDLFCTDLVDVQHTQIKHDLTQQSLILFDAHTTHSPYIILSDIGQQSEGLDETTLFSFGCIAGTDLQRIRQRSGSYHAELRWLESTGTRHISSLFDVRTNTSHMTDGSNIGQTCHLLANQSRSIAIPPPHPFAPS